LIVRFDDGEAPSPSTRLKELVVVLISRNLPLRKSVKEGFSIVVFCCAVPAARVFQLIRYFAIESRLSTASPPIGDCIGIVAPFFSGCLFVFDNPSGGMGQSAVLTSYRDGVRSVEGLAAIVDWDAVYLAGIGGPSISSDTCLRSSVLPPLLDAAANGQPLSGLPRARNSQQ